MGQENEADLRLMMDNSMEVLREGARALLTQAVEAEVAALLSCHAEKHTDDGRQRLKRGFLSNAINVVAPYKWLGVWIFTPNVPGAVGGR
jgi:hypothetical protein